MYRNMSSQIENNGSCIFTPSGRRLSSSMNRGFLNPGNSLRLKVVPQYRKKTHTATPLSPSQIGSSQNGTVIHLHREVVRLNAKNSELQQQIINDKKDYEEGLRDRDIFYQNHIQQINTVHMEEMIEKNEEIKDIKENSIITPADCLNAFKEEKIMDMMKVKGVGNTAITNLANFEGSFYDLNDLNEVSYIKAGKKKTIITNYLTKLCNRLRLIKEKQQGEKTHE